MAEHADRLVPLCHYRWMIPVLGELTRSRGAKFATLANRIGVSPDALRRTLDRLIELELAMRNPGYGHPLRPEYVTTAAGDRMGNTCAELYDHLLALDLEQVALQKWSLPVLVAIGARATRFRDVRRALPGATARAVTTTLKSLTEHDLIERVVTDDYPPSVTYRASRSGRGVARIARDLAARCSNAGLGA